MAEKGLVHVMATHSPLSAILAEQDRKNVV